MGMSFPEPVIPKERTFYTMFKPIFLNYRAEWYNETQLGENGLEIEILCNTIHKNLYLAWNTVIVSH